MKNWFKIELTNGAYWWIRSSRGWVGLIPHIAKLSNEPRCNGATVRSATWAEGLMCAIRYYILGDDVNCTEV